MVGWLATRPLWRIPAPALFSFRRSFVWSQADHTDVDPTSSSSSSSLSQPQSQEERRQQQAHRLASVIDAVNDRKLPLSFAVAPTPSGNVFFLSRGMSSHPKADAGELPGEFLPLGEEVTLRSETDIVNVVEQRIWRSMEEGHFENLPGKGKPLDLGTNPHADPAEDTLYRILSRNGCAPEWVELNKEIRCRIAEWRLALKKAWANKVNHQGSSTWSKDSESLKGEMRGINDKVLHYNLIAPSGCQMFGLKWEKETDKLQ